jgi:hypothetical protein
MAKKEILSPAGRRAGAVQEKTRAVQTQQIKDEIKKRQGFAAKDGDADVTSKANQEGRFMLRQAFVKKVRKLNPNLFYERSIRHPDQGGLYLNDNQIDPLTLQRVGKRMVCSFPHHKISEFDVRQMIDKRIPDPDVPLHWQNVPDLDQHIPGWRSCLYRLFQSGLIEFQASVKEFDLTQGRSSQNWQKAVNA